MKKKIFIYGAGGLGQEIKSLLRALPEWNVEGFFDDNIATGTQIAGATVVGNIEDLNKRTDKVNVVLALGNPTAKSTVLSRITCPNITFPTLIHPGSILQDIDTIEVGEGSIITAGVVMTTNIAIGKHVLVNLQCTVGHHSTIGNFSSLMPGVNISGNVTVGNGVLIGSGANVINNVSIGDHSIVGMGSTVIHAVPPSVTVVGNPAKSIA